MGAYKGKASVFKEADEKTNGFKKGGMADKKMMMSSAAKGERPRRATGGSVLSSASGGTPRGKASHY
jgi:hypothetical protein